MPVTQKWIFTAAMDVDPDKEALFNEVYDQEHVPHLRRVPGVISVTRAVLDTLRTAFNDDRQVRLDYRRTGLQNGLILRVAYVAG